MSGYQETRPRNHAYVRNAIAPIGTDQGEELLIGRGMDEIIAKLPEPYYRTEYGAAYLGDALELIRHVPDSRINLIMTSPPFALTKKKPYGNTKATQYVDWFKPFAREFWRVLTDDGSLVIHIGGSWDKGQPTRSLYHFELLFELCRPEQEDFKFYLAQDFYWFNPAKLPAPAEWVTIRRVRAKDAVDPIWWLSKSPFPKANNRRVLTPYSKAMKKLLENGYNSGLRPSGHNISSTFQQDHGGAIPPNLLAISNTESNSDYLRSCRAAKLPAHPARYPVELPEFFIKFLTDEDDWVLDPFAGSNTTGQAAENNLRRWIAFEKDSLYLRGSMFRFCQPALCTKSD
jgi:site-specific DNA-methyltransferase (cytosine-N4-specific)